MEWVLESRRSLGYMSEMTRLYFSQANIQKIQKGIRRRILSLSNGKVKMKVDQDELDLHGAMVSIVSESRTNDIKGLNEKTISQLSKEILENVKQQYISVKTLLDPVKVPPRAINDNIKGTKDFKLVI